MGTDIYSGSGVIASVDDMVKIVNGKNKRLILEACKKFHNELVQSWAGEGQAWRKEVADHFKPLAEIPFNSKLDVVRNIIASTVVVEGEPSKYGECSVMYSEYIQDLFDRFMDIANINLPYLREVTAFGSHRYNGWSVPLGVACFIFDSSDCFVTTLSEQGQAVKKLIGSCEATEWTEMSY